MQDTLYAELLWIAYRAHIKPGWAYIRYKQLTGKRISRSMQVCKPVKPHEDLLEHCKDYMSRGSFSLARKTFLEEDL